MGIPGIPPHASAGLLVMIAVLAVYALMPAATAVMERLDTFSGVFSKYCEGRGSVFVDLADHMPGLLESSGIPPGELAYVDGRYAVIESSANLAQLESLHRDGKVRFDSGCLLVRG